MALVSTFIPTVAGAAPTYGNAAAGDTVQIGDTLVVKNGGGVSVTVTVATPGNLATGDAFPDKQYTVTAGAEAWLPMIRAYADPADGLAHLTWSATASVTRAAVRTP